MNSSRCWSRAPSLPCQTTSPSAVPRTDVSSGSGSGSPQTTDTPVTCPAPVRQLTSVSADWTSGLALAAASAEPCSRSFDVTVNARIVQPALSIERTTTLAPTR